MLQPGEVDEGVLVACAAHFKRGTQVDAHGRPLRLAEDPAAVVAGELRAGRTGWFAVGHVGDGGRNRGFDAARAATDAAIHANLHRAAVRVLFAR
jgi:hypothetical protein